MHCAYLASQICGDTKCSSGSVPFSLSKIRRKNTVQAFLLELILMPVICIMIVAESIPHRPL